MAVKKNREPTNQSLLVGALVAIRALAANLWMLVWAADRVTGVPLALVVTVALLCDLVRILFVFAITGVVRSLQLMDPYNRIIISKIPGLGIFLQVPKENPLKEEKRETLQDRSAGPWVRIQFRYQPDKMRCRGHIRKPHGCVRLQGTSPWYIA